jgi:hypothetical protein
MGHITILSNKIYACNALTLNICLSLTHKFILLIGNVCNLFQNYRASAKAKLSVMEN